LLLAGGLALLAVDLPVARACANRDWPDEIHRFLRSIEPFGTPYGQGAILLCVAIALPELARRVPRMAVIAVSAGLAADVIKLLVGRERPKYFDLQSASAFDSFVAWLPFLRDGSSIDSFPSAHTASAVGFAIALAWLFPRGRVAFGALAATVAVQRLEVCQHFVSDLCFGATTGWLVAQALLAGTPAARAFDRWESASASGCSQPARFVSGRHRAA
jgi:membrane-associated phospholipid phosphatase